MLEPGKLYRTFSFDNPVNFGSSGVITGLNDPTNTLEVKYVSGVSMANHTVTFSPASGDWAAKEGFIIVGTGVPGEYYPVQPATGTPAARTNNLKGSGNGTITFGATTGGTEHIDLSSSGFRYFIMKGGDFYYCTGASADESDAKSWLFSDWDDVPNTTAWDR